MEPKPASDNVVLHLPEGQSSRMTIDLYDLNGMLIRNMFTGTSITIDDTYEFSVEDLLPGVYYCQVRDGEVSVTMKLVVAK